MISENEYELCADIDPEEIVISGISGSFPGSDNMKQLQEHLFNNVDLITDKHIRWNSEHPDLPKRLGIINNLNKFDAEFFDICDSYANTLDPSLRILLERTYEAIVDAGINPKQLQGRNIATIVATSSIESQSEFVYRDIQMNGMNFLGCQKTTLPNLVSYWLNLKGPSYVVDTACSGSLHAVALAYYNIISGVLSPTGYCRPFDVNANGYCRSETVSVIYLQKAKNAKRIYALCKHVKINSDGYKDEGITFPSENAQTRLLTEFYEECGISPTDVDYIEAHGTGTKVGDPVEIKAISNNRTGNWLYSANDFYITTR
ncbi:fatty acid synthase-like [Pseudomyrmex gracilis]|uniref:fatty acid synthase-like n=1 Tax=Pseudomyrmex gracilis TaxID=219809 RepID=UPI000994E027|nr:fatty acid synthase-like [Pseudomyrmex gracilis]